MRSGLLLVLLSTSVLACESAPLGQLASRQDAPTADAEALSASPMLKDAITEAPLVAADAACEAFESPYPKEPASSVPLEPPLEQDPATLVRTELAARYAAARAYVYGYPAVLMDRTRAAATAVDAPVQHPIGAPKNQFVHLRELPGPDFREVVRPNRDTLYSSAFLDLSEEPYVLSVPALTAEPLRFVMFTFLDAWTNAFASPGTHDEGREASSYVVVGPNYTGPLPPELPVIEAPTDAVWLLGRLEVFSSDDLPAVHALQDQLDLRPLSAYGDLCFAPPTDVPFEPADREHPIPEQIASMATREPFDGEFYEILARLLGNEPPQGDEDVLADLATIGILPGAFDFASLPPHIQNGLREGMQDGQSSLALAQTLAGLSLSPWAPGADVPLGDYGDQYLVRAVVAKIGFGTNRREDAVYMNTGKDNLGLSLDGAARDYTLHFEPGDLPSDHVEGFWSITIYSPDGYLVPNVAERYLLGSHDRLRADDDGGLTLHLANAAPLEAQDNWLPIPAGPFEATLRFYAPDQALVKGTWVPPAMERVGLF